MSEEGINLNICTILSTNVGCKLIVDGISVWFPGEGATQYFNNIYINNGYNVKINKCEVIVALNTNKRL